VYQKIDIPAVNILLIDDHSLVAEGFCSLLDKMLPEGSVIHTADTLEKAANYLQQQHYDFVLTDLLMPGEQVSDFIRHMHKQYPELNILVVSSVKDTHTVKECFALGANGYISKGVSRAEIKMALENTYKGRKYISSDLSGRLAASVLFIENSSLTKKELEVLRLIAAGHQTRVIAEMLHISPVTIMTHKRNLMQKLNIHSAVGLVKYAYDHHLI